MPNIVKGSKQARMVVQPYRPWRKFFLTLLVIVVVAGAGAGGYFYADFYSLRDQFTAQTDNQQRSQEFAQLAQENADLRRQLALLDRSTVMDKRVNEEIQHTIASLRERNAQLEQDVIFYRNVMDDDGERSGLIIGQLDVEKTIAPNRFRYKLVVGQQDSGNDTYLNGHVNVNLVGTRNGEEVAIPLNEVSDSEDQTDIKLRFKYFQNIEGELEIPEGFNPDHINIAAQSTAPTESSINRNFSWVVEGG